MRVGAFVVAMVAFAVASIAAQGKKTILSAEPGVVFSVLTEVTATEYRIESIDKPSLTVSFRTGASMRSISGQDGSCVVLPQNDGAASTVICNTEKRGGAFSWGEGGAVQKKVLKLLTKELAARGLIPSSEVVK